MRNLIIADKQDITNAGIKYIINTCKIDNLGRIFNSEDKISLITTLSENTNSIVIVDYTLFDFSSVTELQILHERYPESSWIIFSDELSNSFLRQMLVNDLPFIIVLKSSTSEEIEQAIKAASVYKPYLCKSIENHIKLLRRSITETSNQSLTVTEKDILKEMASGKTTKEIAAKRNVSFHTIMTHRKNIFRKLDVNNVHEATIYAMKAGIVDLSEYYI